MSLLSIIRSEQWKLVSLALNHPQYCKFNERDARENTALHILAQKLLCGEHALIPQLVEHLDVNTRNARGQTPLHVAIKHKQYETATALIANGANVNVYDKYGHSPLYYATVGESIKMVQELYANGADLSHRDRGGENVLHHAVRCDHRALAVFYLNKGVEINVANACGQVALEVAVEMGHAEIALALIGSNANIPKEVSLLHKSARLGNLHLANILAKVLNVNALDVEGRSALYVATEEGRAQIVKMLLQREADPNLADVDGYTPLHVAVQKGHLEILQMFISYAQRVKNYQHPISVPSMGEHPMDQTKLDYCKTTNAGDNILHILAASRLCDQLKMDTFQLLLQLNLKKLVVRTNKVFRTPLHFANHCFCRPLVSAFINLGADRDEIDGFGKKPEDYRTVPDGVTAKIVKKDTFTRNYAKHVA